MSCHGWRTRAHHGKHDARRYEHAGLERRPLPLPSTPPYSLSPYRFPLQRFRRKQEESTGDLASAYLIPNILLLPILYAVLDPSSNTFPWLVALYTGMGVSDPDLWRLLARITYYDEEDEDEEDDDEEDARLKMR